MGRCQPPRPLHRWALNRRYLRSSEHQKGRDPFEMARTFMERNCRKSRAFTVGDGDFIIGPAPWLNPRDHFQNNIDFAKELRCRTIQVSVAPSHARTDTPTKSMSKQRGVFFLESGALADSGRAPMLPHIEYPHLSKAERMGS